MNAPGQKRQSGNINNKERVRKSVRGRYHCFFGSDSLLMIISKQPIQEVNGLERENSIMLDKLNWGIFARERLKKRDDEPREQPGADFRD